MFCLEWEHSCLANNNIVQLEASEVERRVLPVNFAKPFLTPSLIFSVVE